MTTEAVMERPSLLQPLRRRDFRLVFSGETVSLIGDQFHFIALAWLVLQLTGSGLALGSVLMVAAVPRAVFMLLGGALSDRMSPRSLMLWSNAIRAVVVAIIAALVLTGNAQLWQLYGLALVFGTVDALFYPALNAMVPMLVTDGLLPPANALMQGVQQLTGLIGPAMAGVLVAAVNTGPAFAIDAVSFAVAATALAFVAGGRRTVSPQDGAAQASVLANIGEGIRYAISEPPVRVLLVLTTAMNLGFTGPVAVGLPYLADSRFGGAAAYGLMGSGFGAGALTGALLAGALHYIPRLGYVSIGAVMFTGIAFALVGSAPDLPIAMVLGFLIGVGIGFSNVRIIAWLQARTPERLRGRVMSVLMLGSVGLAPVSLAIAGFVVDFGAVSLLFWLAGGLIVVASLAGLVSGAASLIRDAEPAT